MRLLRVEIEGFKSFAKKTQLSFGSGITAVIGPNGSGKSNLSEAVRWVLGEQSLKSLRGKERTDIIFSGSDNQSKSRQAFVRLTFDNESGRFPFQSPEVTIARTLNRSGESEYTVNTEQIRLVDLQHMLAKAGIGTKSYTVISQGTVDRYLTATPEARRELFDEATGIRPLQIKTHEAHKKLRQTQQHAEEVTTIMHELQPRLQVLARQVKRYEEREALEKEFAEKQAAWFHHCWHKHICSIQEIEKDAKASKGRIASARKTREELERAFFRAAKHADAPLEALRQELKAAQYSYEKDLSNYSVAQKQKEELEASITNLEHDLAVANKALQEQRNSSLQAQAPVTWASRARKALTACQELLQKISNRQKLSSRDILAAREAIADVLADTEDIEPSARVTQDILKTFAKPLQDVARLQATLQERKAALQRLPVPPMPTQDAITAAESALQAAQAKQKEGGRADTTEQVTQERLAEAREQEVEAEKEGSRIEAALTSAAQDLARLEQDILRERGTAFLQTIQGAPPPTFPSVPNEEELRYLAHKISSLGESDPLILKEYQEVSERYANLEQQMRDIEEAKQNIMRLLAKLEKAIRDHFSRQFRVIDAAFSRYFLRLFDGGEARLRHSEEGIDIIATPPGKRSRAISLLSGGEKALTSLALLLAILEAQQPPFIVLDEVDAALDEANSHRFGSILREHSNHTQSILITHNREIMAQADVLYGVTMTEDGISNVYSVHLQDSKNPQAVDRAMAF